MILIPKLVAVLFAGLVMMGAWNAPWDGHTVKYAWAAQILTLVNMVAVTMLVFR